MKHLESFNNNSGWVKFDENDESTFPPEGESVLTTDGSEYAVLWYLLSSTYEWQWPVEVLEAFDEELSDIPLPFDPVYWMFLPKLP